jgi:hypothetical protein
MATKVQQTPHHPFKSFSDTDLSSVTTDCVTAVDDKKRVTIQDASQDATASVDQSKSKTLPSRAKLGLALKRTNSLKRSITLPR